MPLERTPKYDAEIEAVRRLPQETPEQKAEKKDAAALLRMEALFDNAACAKFYIEHILANPDMTREEFLYDAEQIGNIVHPDAAVAFVDQLVNTRTKIIQLEMWARDKIVDEDYNLQQKQLEEYQKALYEQGHDTQFVNRRVLARGKQMRVDSEQLVAGNINVSNWLGQRLFTKYLSKTPEKPKGRISLDMSHPLAVIMNFSNKEDYKRIDPKDNVGGFHRAEQKVDLVSFPLIAVNADQGTGVQKHEVGHAENSVLKHAKIRKADDEPRRLVWSNRVSALAENEITFLQAETPKDLDGDPAKLEQMKKKKQALERRMLHFALGRAKDELLAEYNVQPDFPFHYKSYLLKKEGIYDYFKDAGIAPGTALYNRLWHQYTNLLNGACSIANPVANTYFSRGLTKKFENFRWVLAQIPLENWEKQLEAALFEKESDLLVDCYEFMRHLDEDDAGQLIDRRQTLAAKLRTFLSENELRPLLPGLREIKKEQEIILVDEKEQEQKRIAEAAERERKRPDEALMKIWEEMEDYEAMILEGVRSKTKKLYEARMAIEEYYFRRCDEEGIAPNQEFFASYLEDHNWNSNIMKIRKDKLPGHEMYTSL